MGHLGEHVRRGMTDEPLLLNALQKLTTRWPVYEMWLKVVDEDVGVQKDRGPRRQFDESHGCSGGGGKSSSGSVAK